MNRMRRRKLEVMPLSALWQLRDDLQAIIAQLENRPRREIDIATDHTGDPTLIAQVLRVEGDKTSGKWIQVERIFCSIARCTGCPHGDYHYEYRYNKKKGTTTVRFKGQGFTQESLQSLQFFTLEGDSITISPPERRLKGGKSALSS